MASAQAVGVGLMLSVFYQPLASSDLARIRTSIDDTCWEYVNYKQESNKIKAVVDFVIFNYLLTARG